MTAHEERAPQVPELGPGDLADRVAGGVGGAPPRARDRCRQDHTRDIDGADNAIAQTSPA